MKKQLTKEDITNAKAIHLYNEDTIYVELSDCKDVYGSCKGGEWFIKEDFWDYWESSQMLSYFKLLTPDEAFERLERWQAERISDIQADNCRLNNAISFATERHSKQLRKSTDIPYILHPIEVLQILYSMRADTNVMIAGVLHDTVDDSHTTYEEIRELFGDDVAQLVATNSEVKSKNWEKHRQHAVSVLENADLRVKMLILADKVSNLRSIVHDQRIIGDELWNGFDIPKDNQSWYYSNIQDSLYDMQLRPNCADAYWELVGLYKDIFVKYYLDETEQAIYQICDDIDVFYLKKGNPQWKDVSSPPQSFSYEILEKLTPMSRKDAELLEDIWNKPFWDCHNRDMKDGLYSVYCSKNRDIQIKILKQSLILHCEDFGQSCKSINGKDEYEFSYTLNVESSHRFLTQLRMKHGLDIKLSDIFKREFGSDKGTILFENVCKKIGIQYEFSSY